MYDQFVILHCPISLNSSSVFRFISWILSNRIAVKTVLFPEPSYTTSPGKFVYEIKVPWAAFACAGPLFKIFLIEVKELFLHALRMIILVWLLEI